LEEALFCGQAAADYLGFNFVPASSRHIDMDTAKSIIAGLPSGRLETVGVFRDERPEKVLQIAEVLHLDFVQLHGNENEDYVRLLPNLRIIKVINGDSLPEKFPAEFVMIDREIQGQGMTVDFQKLSSRQIGKPLFLAGGLKPENVRQAVSIVRPYAVDVASGVETNGKKDPQKIRKFITQVNSL